MNEASIHSQGKKGSPYLRRRAPVRRRNIESRETLRVALKIDSLSVAKGNLDADWAEPVTAREARLQGWNAEAQQRLDVDRASR